MLAPNATLGIAAAVMSPVLPQLAVILHGAQAAQMAAVIVTFGMILGGFVSGRLINRWGTRSLIIASMVTFAFSGFAGALSTDPVLILGSRFVLGVAAACFSTASLALTTEKFIGDKRSNMIGLQQAVSQAVNVVGVLVTGALAALVGWRSPFILLGLYGLLVLVMALPSVRSATAQATDRLPAQVRGVQDRLLWIMMPIGTITILMGFLNAIPWTQLPFVLASAGFGAPSILSFIAAINFVAATSGALVYGFLARHLGRRATYAVALLIGTSGVALMGKVNSLPLFAMATAFAGVGTGLGNSFAFDFGVEVAPDRHKATSAGYLFSFICVGFALDPLIARGYEEIFGRRGALFAIGLCALLLGLLGVLINERKALSHSVPQQMG